VSVTSFTDFSSPIFPLRREKRRKRDVKTRGVLGMSASV
jgi:hypothetical protein